MRKFIAIAAAISFLGATSLTPVFAASTDFSSQAAPAAAAPASDAKAPAAKSDAKMPAKKMTKKHKKMAKKHKKMSKKMKKPVKHKPSTTNEGAIFYTIAA